jgi:short-subunit dehydrogenase
VELAGKTVLLSGATGGLGQAIARALADRGATLVLSARGREALEKMASALPGEGHRVAPVDLSEPGAAEALVSEAGEVDGLVANAGVQAAGRLERTSQEEIGRQLRVNLEAPIRMTRELLPRMIQRGNGHLVYISSLSARAPTARASIYTATKAGLRGFALALRVDVAPLGIGVSVISPGLIREAGMFADSGAKAPMVLGTSSPGKVARSVVRAFERNRADLSVAPRRQRALSNLAQMTPGIAIRVTSSRFATGIANRITATEDE